MNVHKNTPYINRDISWLSFNYLVLKQIQDKTLPIYERIKFLAIYSSNLDEFYKVRVASNRSLINLYKNQEKKTNTKLEKVLKQINKEVIRQKTEYDKTFFEEILPELEKEGIILYRNQPLNAPQKEFINTYFQNEILPYIQPVLLSSSGAVLSFLQDNVIYLALKMYRKKEKSGKKTRYAVVKNPTRHLPRFIQSNIKYNNKHLIFFLEDIIKLNISALLPGYNIETIHTVKVSRNADYMIDDEFTGNLFEKISDNIKKRKTGFPARFVYHSEMPEDLLKVLQKAFNINDNDLMPAGPIRNYYDFFKFPNPIGKHLEISPQKPLKHPTLERYESLFDAVKKHDILLHFPYHSYDYVLRFFHQAAIDPLVEQIKTTQYRVATNSAIVNALITAARNNKKVTVFVELKARFDEKNNMQFAEIMRKEGINVIASIPGLKVHSKAAIVIRKSKKNKERKSLAFVSTGNFNEKTAKQYCDEGFFTSNKKITSELEKMFCYLESPFVKFKFKHILIPRFNFRKEFFKLIDNEIKEAQNNRKARIIIKVNGLQEEEVIDKLYEAGNKNVRIDLIVRGICRFRASDKFTKNVKVTRIVDRYLEHSRIFAFYNGGDWKVYLSTADLMTRNLKRRVEIAVPIWKKKLRKEIIDMLHIQLKDNVKAKHLDEDINNIDIPVKPGKPPYKAQEQAYIYLKKQNDIAGI